MCLILYPFYTFGMKAMGDLGVQALQNRAFYLTLMKLFFLELKIFPKFPAHTVLYYTVMVCHQQITTQF